MEKLREFLRSMFFVRFYNEYKISCYTEETTVFQVTKDEKTCEQWTKAVRVADLVLCRAGRCH